MSHSWGDRQELDQGGQYEAEPMRNSLQLDKGAGWTIL